jgi:hypothetical protein
VGGVGVGLVNFVYLGNDVTPWLIYFQINGEIELHKLNLSA